MFSPVSYNPFQHITKTRHSRILTTSFREKLEHIFEALAGGLGDDEDSHVGIFDYVTLMIPLVFTRWTI